MQKDGNPESERKVRMAAWLMALAPFLLLAVIVVLDRWTR